MSGPSERTLRKLGSPERRELAHDYYVNWRDRPKRAMWPAEQVAAWHAEHHPERLLDGLWPACMACGRGDDSWANFERAHLITRCFSGLDGPQNLVLLCAWCHQNQPDFLPGEEQRAWLWVETQDDYWASIWAVVDRIAETGGATWRGQFVSLPEEVQVA
jgi:5-methylcytosine-specific restriction endonuclease McrA